MIIISVSVVLIIALAVAGFMFFKKDKAVSIEKEVTSVKVTRGTILNVVEGSGALEANEQYNITSLVTGDIKSDHFNEGDIVRKDQVLYKIDSASVEKNIEKSNNALSQAQLSYNEAVKSLENLNCFAKCSGTITAMHVKKGDKISSGAKLCDIIENETMVLKLQFLESQADMIYVGQSADVEVMGDSGTYKGSVLSVSGGTQINELGAEVKTVEIGVVNPGSIVNTDTATAVVGGYACASPGTFDYAENTSVVSEASGEIEEIYFEEGDRVNNGSLILKIKNDSVENQVKKAKLSLNDAQISKNNLQDDLDKYSIKAPITGKIIQKNSKAGDKMGSSSQATSNVMAVVADLTKFKLTINIDELEISEIKVGQKATITIDALGGKSVEGVVNNISIIGTSSNGVTTYPVEILIDGQKNKDLIPGMNVDATIVVKEKNNALLLPAVAIKRGNTVTKDGKETKVEIGITDGVNVEITKGLSEGDEVTYETIKRPTGQNGNSSPMGGSMPGMGGMPGMGSMGGGMPRTGGMSGGGMPRTGGMTGGGMR